MRCGSADRRIVPVGDRPRKWGRAPEPPPSSHIGPGWRALPTAAASSRPASVYIPAAQQVVERSDSSALAAVRPTTVPPHTSRCPRTSDYPLLLLRRSLGSIRRQNSARPCGTPCRKAHRNENQAISSLCRATPSVTSERFPGLLGSSPIPLSSSLLAFT